MSEFWNSANTQRHLFDVYLDTVEGRFVRYRLYLVNLPSAFQKRDFGGYLE